jgi:tetratricopeptide (TPR) repeat protein
MKRSIILTPRKRGREFGTNVVLVCLVAAFFHGALAQLTPSSAVKQTRSVTIVTEPDTTVFIDGVRFGRTDKSGRLTIRTVAPGRHALRLRADGFKETEKSLAVAQGEIKIALVKTNDPAEFAFQEAERLTTQDRDKAAEAYRKAIKLRPNYTAAYIGLARVLSDSGDYDDALKAIRDLRRTSPQNAEASAVEGRIYRDSGDEAKAIAAFKRAITQGHGFQPEAYTGLGLIYKEKAEAAGGAGNFADETNNYNEAAKYLNTALKQLSGAPDAAVLYQLLGLVYERQKQFQNAIRLYNEFLAVFPDSSDASAVRSFIEQIKKQMP